MSTIDPGIGEGIKEHAEDVEDSSVQKEQGDTGNSEDPSQPSKWWFASTACPLLAGTFGPVASGFNICALVYPWRQYIPSGGTQSTSEQAGQTLPDPPFLIALNVASLVCALCGNASLLLNMAQRVRFSTAQPITIIGFVFAGILLIADLVTLSLKPHYAITRPEAIPDDRHALTGAFYYAIFAAAIYVMIGLLMLMTVYGAIKGHFKREFQLTGPQRTLMLQTMSFVAYLLLGALVFSHVEGWEYLNAVYWADVTLLTIGLGDYSPSTPVGQGLLFPFAIGGILMVGLVVGSIRSLVLDRGQEKIIARIVEKKRSSATHHVNERQHTIRISMFAKADLSTDPKLSQAQRRKQEFVAMRKVQEASEKERRWFGLLTSGAFALILWFGGAAIFRHTEYLQQWTYLEALYFSYTSLLTIGYGTPHPQSNSGKAFFVIWSLLAVPSLTILISNMGDTIVKWFSSITVSVAAITILPGEMGFRAGFRKAVGDISTWVQASLSSITPPGIFGDIPSVESNRKIHPTTYEDLMRGRLAKRLTMHAPQDAELDAGDDLGSDIKFYHYVLARECRYVQNDLGRSPEKKYSWEEWEYFLKLIGNEENPEDYSGQEHLETLVPKKMRVKPQTHRQSSIPMEGVGGPDVYANGSPSKTMTDICAPTAPAADNDFSGKTPTSSKPSHGRNHQKSHRSHVAAFYRNWSWLSNQSPLMSNKTEAEWILDRLSAALERELDRERKGHRRHPPIRLLDARSRSQDHKVISEKRP